MGTWIGDAVCGTFDVFEGVAWASELGVQVVDGTDDEENGEGVGGWIGEGGLFQVGGGEEGGLSLESQEEWRNVLLTLEAILGRSSQSRLHG